MAIKLDDFYKLRQLASEKLPDRILAILLKSEHAHTARDVAGQLLGITGASQIIAPEVDELLPQVQFILTTLVLHEKLVSHTRNETLGPETYYGKPAASTQP